MKTNQTTAKSAAINAKTMSQKRGESYCYAFKQLMIDPEFNVRVDYGNIDELASSIRENGVKTPLKGYFKMVDGEGRIVITEGHRRYRALSILDAEGIEINIPFELEPRGTNDLDHVFGMLINNSGKPLTTLEQAEAVKRLITKYLLKPADIAKRLGKSATDISNMLTLASAPEEVKADVNAGIIKPTSVIQAVRQAGGDSEKVKTAVAAAKTAASDKKSGKVTGKSVLKTKTEKEKVQELADLTKNVTVQAVLDYISGRLSREDAVAIINA